MNVQVVYCSHRQTGLDVRGRLGFRPEDMPRVYDELRSQFPRSELVVLSTCNRVELYTAQETGHSGPSHLELAEFFSRFHSVPLDEFFDEFLERTGPDAVRHLFEVAASLDSMVLGEPQIVSQVKQAYSLAQTHSSTGPLTHALFQRALAVAKRVRTETSLADGRVSIASVAVGDFGRSIFDCFDDKSVLVIGAGEMAQETLRYLRDAGATRITVVNRTLERAEAVAMEFGGRVGAFDELDRWMSESDVIISTLGASPPIVSRSRFATVRTRGRSRPVLILDLGAPRDFEPTIAQLDDGVFLYCIDDLEATCRRNRKARQKEVDQALRIVEDETRRFMNELYHRATGPIVKRLREQWRTVVDQESKRLFARLPHLESDRAEIERMIEQMTNKLLHPPLEALRDEAREGTPHGLLNALKRLFHLSD